MGLSSLLFKIKGIGQKASSEFCLFFSFFGLRWGRLLPQLAALIIFQELPLADSADKWVSKSLIISIFKNAHSGKNKQQGGDSAAPLSLTESYRLSETSCYHVGELWRYFPQAPWTIH